MGPLATALLLALPLAVANPPPLPDAGGVVPSGPVGHPPVPDPDHYTPSADNLTRDWASARIETDLAGLEVGGNLVLEGVAEAQRGYVLSHVEIWVDDWRHGTAVGSSSWRYTLDTTRLLDGAHRVSAYAYAIPRATPWMLALGGGETVQLSTLNHRPGVVLFEKTMDFTGADAETWLVRIAQDYTGVRVTLKTEPAGGAGAGLAPEAQVALAYKGTASEGQDPPTRTWTATYGPAKGATQVSRPPHDALRAPGVLTLEAAIAGEGRMHLRVEALPVLAAAGAAS